MKILPICLLILPLPIFSQWSLAKIFSDHMVFQSQEPIEIWGKGKPGSLVEGKLNKEKRITVIDSDSTWILKFRKYKATNQAKTIYLQSGNLKLELKDVLVGDVWLCLGQSNMEWPMSKELHYRQEISQSQQPLLRFFNPAYAGKGLFGVPYPDSIVRRLNPEEFYSGSWQTSDSLSFQSMSAVGYYFGKEIISDQKIPIGLINLSIGGAPIESFIDLETMNRQVKFAMKTHPDWLKNPSLPEWIRQRASMQVGHLHGSFNQGIGPSHAFMPGFAFQCGILPLLNFSIKGIIFYQGESNAQEADRVSEYGDLFCLMVNNFRSKWGQPFLPIYYVQLSSIDTTNYNSKRWPDFRDEQRKILEKTKHTGMVVSSDAGAKQDVHPVNKKIIGRRLAFWALKNNYNKNILPSGPLPLKARYAAGKVTIWFKFAGKGVKTADDQALRGFSLDKTNEIPASIHNKKILLEVKQKPEYIYYAWNPYTDANLVNSAALPASTFKMKVR